MALYFDSPQDLGRTLDSGFAIYKASLKPLLGLSFLTALLVNLPSIVNYGLFALGMDSVGMTLVMSVVLPLIGLVLYLAGYVGLIWAQDAIARGAAAPSIGQAFGHGVSRLGTMILCGLLLALAVLVGMLLLVVPGIILSVSLGLAMYLVSLEKIGAVDALKRSHNLVWGNWWRTMIVVTVGVLLYGVPLVLVGAVVGFTVAMGGTVAGMEGQEEQVATITLVMAIAQIVISGILMPLMNGFLLAQLNDLKLRKSGADLLARAPA